VRIVHAVLSTHPTNTEGFRVANIKSHIKRNRQNEQRRQRNKAVKSEVKTYVRRFHEAADAGDSATATERLKTAVRELDKAASKGVIHKNQAANRKSALAKRAASL
jgi:small subunit ribosomal protein S20